MWIMLRVRSFHLNHRIDGCTFVELGAVSFGGEGVSFGVSSCWRKTVRSESPFSCQEEVKPMRNARLIWLVFLIVVVLLYLYLYSPWAQVMPRF